MNIEEPWANHYAKIYPNKSNDEINKLAEVQVKPFSELNEADGAAWATFDIYRFLSIGSLFIILLYNSSCKGDHLDCCIDKNL